jgi:N-succinyldiaminopimelate aminotransferase
MNPLLQRLHPYPFERWRELTRDITPNPAYAPISLGIGEPKHPAPRLLEDALVQALPGLSSYPATAGEPALRAALVGWVQRRYGVALNAATQVLPVNGSREALFAFAQTVVDASKANATVVCPNPFYQIYEGAALLAGAQTCFVPSDPQRSFASNWSAVPAETWARTQLLYVCSPGNPTGAVMPLSEWQQLFALSDQYGFVIASDECYSEIYFREDPPLGSLQAAQQLGRSDFRNLVAFTSLSKRSNVPGLRSGFVAGDETILKAFLLYRTYHGSAMSPMVQRASAVAWGDEQHVQNNRALYRAKFAQVLPVLEQALDVQLPDAGFYLWARLTPPLPPRMQDDVQFARALLAQYNVQVLPGSLLARSASQHQAPAGEQGPYSQSQSHNPGTGRIRMALVAPVEECLEAARRIAHFVESFESHDTQTPNTP